MDKYQAKTKSWLASLLGISLLASACGSDSEVVEDVSPASTPELPEQSIEQFLVSQNFSGAVLLARNGNIELNQGVGFVDRTAKRTTERRGFRECSHRGLPQWRNRND